MADWYPIPDHPGYEITRSGEVRRGGRVLASRVDHHGYLCVGVQRTPKQVHRLLMAVFAGPAEGRVVRHLDGNSLNNDLNNLTYGTPAENSQDTVRHGTHANAAKATCPSGHPYDEANTYRDKRGRHCRACNREAVRRYKARRAAA